MSTRLTARWLAPVTTPPIENGALLVDDDGRIAAIGPAASVPVPDDAACIDLGEAILLPGLVNAHAHPELGMMRGLLENLPFHDWIPALKRIKRETPLTGADFQVAARAACIESLAAGITTMGATEDSDAALVALGEAGMRGVVYREVFGPAPGQADEAIAELREKLAAMRSRATDLVRVGASPHAPYTVSDRLFEGVARLAAEEGCPIAVHIAESEAEHRLVRAGAGPFAERLVRRGIATQTRAASPVALLERTGILRLRPLLIHAVRVDGDDIRRIAGAGAPVAHCPVANARLGNGIAPLTELLDAGVTVALGTDSVAANNRMDLLEEARCAQILQRARAGSPTLLPPDRLLRLA
ncbi:MAG: amidohydrolase family protein, partial [Longimicrobiales bacterium]